MKYYLYERLIRRLKQKPTGILTYAERTVAEDFFDNIVDWLCIGEGLIAKSEDLNIYRTWRNDKGLKTMIGEGIIETISLNDCVTVQFKCGNLEDWVFVKHKMYGFIPTLHSIYLLHSTLSWLIFIGCCFTFSALLTIL